MDKRPMRNAVFALDNAMEQALLAHVLQVHGTGNDWTRYLGPGSVSRIMAYWDEARARDLELHPLHYASLTHLINIAKASPVLHRRLEALGENWPEEMINLRDFARDPVSHPGKPLVDSPAKIPLLWQACE